MNDNSCEALLTLISKRPFDADRATCLIEDIANIDLLLPERWGKTTLLQTAVECNNLDAVRFLLERGANPNFYDEETGIYPFFELRFAPDDDTDTQNRLKIAKLFLDYGADSSIPNEEECLYDNVTFEVFDEPIWSEWDYLLSLYKLLIAYGGHGPEYGKPELSEPIDKKRIDDYDIRFYQCEDGYHIEGHVITPDGRDIGIL